MCNYNISNKKYKGFTLVELLASMALLALITLMVFVIFGQSTKVWKKSGARMDQHIAARAILDQMAREIRGAVLVGQYGFAGPSSGSIGEMDFFVFSSTEDNNLQSPEWRNSEQQFSDQIYFVAPLENYAAQDYCIIGYWVRDTKGDSTGSGYDSNKRKYETIENTSDDVLMRYFVTDGKVQAADPIDPDWQDMDFRTPAGGTNSNELALNVKSLRIRCWSDYDGPGNHFTTTWEDESGNPTDESKVNWDSVVGGSSFVSPSEDYDDGRLPKAVKITIVVQDEKEIEKEREFSTVVYLENAKR